MTEEHREVEKEQEGRWRSGDDGGSRGGGELAGDLSHTRALLQATIACVVIVLKAWRPGPSLPFCGPLYVGAAAYPSFLWPV